MCKASNADSIRFPCTFARTTGKPTLPTNLQLYLLMRQRHTRLCSLTCSIAGAAIAAAAVSTHRIYSISVNAVYRIESLYRASCAGSSLTRLFYITPCFVSSSPPFVCLRLSTFDLAHLRSLYLLFNNPFFALLSLSFTLHFSHFLYISPYFSTVFSLSLSLFLFLYTQQ